MSGYEIRQLIDRSIVNFWTESYGQIYPALKSLVQRGFAEQDRPEQGRSGRPARKLYRLTDKGRDRLVHWLAAPAREQVPRNELLLKVFFGFQQAPERTADHIRTFLSEQRRLHERFGAIESTLRREQANDPGLPYWLLTLRYGLYGTEALIRWAEESLNQLEALQANTTN